MSEFDTFRPLYDPTAVQPMRDELTRVGVDELTTSENVDDVLGKNEGTVLLMVNSVCGCAAGNARPGVMLALQNGLIPDRLTTVFAGQDKEATEKARSYMSEFPPSSPCIAVFQDGRVHTIIERHNIEGRSPQDIAIMLVNSFNNCCEREGPSIPREEFEKIIPAHICGSTIAKFEDAAPTEAAEDSSTGVE
ncbi:MAG: BrxA/BrxB family bacilliredoxin [Planctomycetota bacterium]|nr:BrxA/BrxB family bacilliredoxin [Planctomycetota bacterium]MEE3199882.1 BrxA/BrxB family bacilliredoxin [Planctomycetota bacterium]